jgi:nucleoside-diphosphate-sugar epimerase
MQIAQESRLDRYRGLTAAVFGASGFIGRWVARALCAHGAYVLLVVRDRAVAQAIFSRYEVRGEVCEVDLAHRERVRKFYQKYMPAITFNLAGYGVDPAERNEAAAYQLNSDLIGTICEALPHARDAWWLGQEIVHAGSMAEYGAIGGNLSEDSLPRPTTLYGRSKLAGTHSLTHFCRSKGIRGLTARLFTVYGPGEHPGRLLPSLQEAARSGQPLPLTQGLQTRDFTFVEDVAEGLLRLGLARPKPGEVINLATGRMTAVRAFAETAAGILEIPADRLQFGALPSRTDEAAHTAVNLARLRQLLGWVPPTPISEGIRRTQAFAGCSKAPRPLPSGGC